MVKICGIGINDYDGKVTYVKNGKKKIKKSYQVWNSMIKRCYSEKLQKRQPTYKGCKVSKEWLSYCNFKKWYDKNYPRELAKNIKFELDKDLLIFGNLLYSEKTCIFLPKIINSFMTNNQKNNTSGCVGVSVKKNRKYFEANISEFGKSNTKYLGTFKTLEDASNAYKKSRDCMSFLARNYMANLGIYSCEVIDKIK